MRVFAVGRDSLLAHVSNFPLVAVIWAWVEVLAAVRLANFDSSLAIDWLSSASSAFMARILQASSFRSPVFWVFSRISSSFALFEAILAVRSSICDLSASFLPVSDASSEVSFSTSASTPAILIGSALATASSLASRVRVFARLSFLNSRLRNVVFVCRFVFVGNERGEARGRLP